MTARSGLTTLVTCLLALGCEPPGPPADRVDFAPLRPGVCEEGALPCDGEGHAWVEVPRDFEDRTYAFVIDSLSFPPATPDGNAIGFDLDGLDSGPGSDDPEAPCGERHRDYASVDDPGVTGVDNQLLVLIPTIEGLLDPADCPDEETTGCLDELAIQSLSEGNGLVIVEVSGIASLLHDDHVLVKLYRVPPSRTPIEVGSDGRIATGQSLHGVLVDQQDGSLLDGRVDVSFTGIPLTVRAGDFLLTLDLMSARMRFDLSEDRLDGVVGGRNEPSVPDGPDGTVCSVVASVSDLEARRTCSDSACYGVSVGARFTAVAARLEP